MPREIVCVLAAKYQNGRENRTDAGRPAEGEREAEQETAGDAGERPSGLGLFLRLAAQIVEADVAIQPARQ